MHYITMSKPYYVYSEDRKNIKEEYKKNKKRKNSDTLKYSGY